MLVMWWKQKTRLLQCLWLHVLVSCWLTLQEAIVSGWEYDGGCMVSVATRGSGDVCYVS